MYKKGIFKIRKFCFKFITTEKRDRQTKCNILSQNGSVTTPMIANWDIEITEYNSTEIYNIYSLFNTNFWKPLVQYDSFFYLYVRTHIGVLKNEEPSVAHSLFNWSQQLAVNSWSSTAQHSTAEERKGLFCLYTPLNIQSLRVRQSKRS